MVKGSMMKVRLVAAVLCLAPTTALGASSDGPVQVMTLGTWHFANPGQDVVNIEAEDVRTPQRQCELDALAAALAEFRPTKIMLEQVAETPALIDESYAAFTPGLLQERKDERVQIGHRLAHRLGHTTVYAVDEQPSEGEPDYFPFDPVVQYAQAHDQMEPIQSAMTKVQAASKAFEDKQGGTHLATLLLEENDPSAWRAGIRGYYEMLKIGDTETQPGAELNAYWYMRNAKIFGKLMTVAEPGDRVLLLFGTGHAYWLRHFANEVMGYQETDPRPYLQRAAATPCQP
jgi:hypothetical protein